MKGSRERRALACVLQVVGRSNLTVRISLVCVMISAAFAVAVLFASLFPRAGVMLLSRYLRRSTRVNASSVHSQQAASSMSDHRTAADVVTTALQNVGDSSKTQLPPYCALEAENIQWAWQLSRLSAEQWTTRLSVCTLGLQMAIQTRSSISRSSWPARWCCHGCGIFCCCLQGWLATQAAQFAERDLLFAPADSRRRAPGDAPRRL